MIKIDPDDVLTQAQVLVGRFMYHWGMMEFEVNQAIGKVLNLGAAQTWIVARNMQLRDKLNVLRTVINLEGPTADGRLIIVALEDIATLANTSRNLIAHDSFYPSRDGRGVEFFRVQARGKFNMPDTVWTPEMFEEKFTSLQAIAAILRGKVVSLKNVLALAKLLAAPPSPSPTAGLLGPTAPYPPDHRGLPLEAVPVLKLESGRDRPADRLTGAQRRAGHGLAARSLPARAVGNRAMSAA